jgi:tRNA-dihydrouridine synthase 1
MLSRSFMPAQSSKDLLAYTPMFHARLFAENLHYRETMFQPTSNPIPSPADPYHQSQIQQADLHLDGNPSLDRPVFVQFCANDPDILLDAARLVQPFCDAVDLNLGCPQGIAKKGHYGAFLQEDQDLIYRLVNKLHTGLDIPVTAKMRILDTREKTLNYAKLLLSAGASIITVHGRQRHQKGHNTGVADWTMIKFLRDNLPPETVIFANGNILQHDDIKTCLDATGADGIMSAEGNLRDPSIFAPPPPLGQEGREYWRGRDGKGGYRLDAVLRRYLDIIYKYVLDQPAPERPLLFISSDPPEYHTRISTANIDSVPAPDKKAKKSYKTIPLHLRSNPNLGAMQPHLFQMLRPLITKHTSIRSALAACVSGDMFAFENILFMVEVVTREGILEYENSSIESEMDVEDEQLPDIESLTLVLDPHESSLLTAERVKRPWWVCQPHVRPLPAEAFAKGAMTVGKKETKKLFREEKIAKETGLCFDGEINVVNENAGRKVATQKEGLACG